MPYKNTSFGELSYERAIIIEHLSRISEFQRENMKPFSIKRIIFIVVQAMILHFGCNYVFYIPRVREFFSHRKQARVQEETETGTQSGRNEQASAR